MPSSDMIPYDMPGPAEREPDGRETGFGHPRQPGGEDSRDIVDAIRPQVGDSVLVAQHR
ncbi:hypothetical protein [Streptomyces sp. NPDC001100]